MYAITVSKGILDPKHRVKMQLNQKTSCIWVYLWLLDKMTSIDLETGFGKVLGGKPIKVEELADFGDRKTVMKIFKKLEDEEYIKTTRTPYGKSVYIAKAKKVFGRKVERSPESGTSENKQSGTSQVNNLVHLGSESGTSNKTEQLDRTVDISVADKTATEKKPKKNYDDVTPMTLKEFYESCNKSKQRHIRLIADYADEKKLNFSTRGQWRAFIDRNLRAARGLSPYSDEQITKAMKAIEKNRDGPKGYITRWTLETLSKYLDEYGT
jgi:hypothetical protein